MTLLNEKVLDADKVRVIRLQAEITRNGQFFLAGGTGLGLRLGHRRSDDIDWFTSRRFESDELRRELERLSEKPVRIEQNGPHTIRAYYGAKDPLETSFITYRQFEAKPESLIVAGSQILLADIEVMAAMKAAAVHDRGSLRDFVDIHTICQQPGWSVSRFIQHAASKLPFQPEQVARALTYFVDADRQPIPAGYKVPWTTVKGDLVKGVRDWERRRGDDLER